MSSSAKLKSPHAKSSASTIDMHELSIMYHVVAQVQRVMQEHNVNEVEAIVLQVGELASVVPKYLHACYPAAVDGTNLQETALEIELLPANGICSACARVYPLTEHEHTCPFCGETHAQLISGQEFLIKEIRAR